MGSLCIRRIDLGYKGVGDVLLFECWSRTANGSVEDGDSWREAERIKRIT